MYLQWDKSLKWNFHLYIIYSAKLYTVVTIVRDISNNKRVTAVSCGATVMMVFNKSASYEISSKSDNTLNLGEEGEGPLFEFCTNFQLTFKQRIFIQFFFQHRLINEDFTILGGRNPIFYHFQCSPNLQLILKWRCYIYLEVRCLCGN